LSYSSGFTQKLFHNPPTHLTTCSRPNSSGRKPLQEKSLNREMEENMKTEEARKKDSW
jgi:hypothetical protein